MRIAAAVIQSSLPREDEMAELFWFSDEQWARIERLLPTNTRGLKRVDDRRVLSGIVHVLRSGCHWSHCPREYGPPKTIYNSLRALGQTRDLGKDLCDAEPLRGP